MSRFVTRYNYVPDKGERNNGEFMIDPTGYIPAKRQIENMLYAGASLDASRLEDYDFRPDVKEFEYREEFDLRKPDADFTDADRIMQHIAERASKGEVQSGSDNPESSGNGVSESGASDSGATESANG